MKFFAGETPTEAVGTTAPEEAAKDWDGLPSISNPQLYQLMAMAALAISRSSLVMLA